MTLPANRPGGELPARVEMCGITGWFDTAGQRPPATTLIQAMTDAIRHRGPDGEGFFSAPGIAFGHRRLAIIDLHTGDQLSLCLLPILA